MTENAILRTARKRWPCAGNGARKPEHSPRCEHVIPAGLPYIEYVGEATAYESGTRHTLDCAVHFGYWKPRNTDEAERIGMDMAGRRVDEPDDRDTGERR
jgi:hypothetical protein